MSKRDTLSPHPTPVTHGYTFHGFSYLWPTVVQKYSMEDRRNKQSVSFKWHVTLSRVMKPPAMPLHPAQDVNHPFVLYLHTVHSTCPFISRSLGYQISCHSVALLVHVTLVLLHNVLKAHEQRCWQFGYTKEMPVIASFR